MEASARRYWQRTDGATAITPQRKRNPEGYWLDDALQGIAAHYESVVDYGCGPGRLTPYFDPDAYLGLDVNPKTLLIAKQSNPRYNFDLLTDDYELPEADLYFLWTVLLHVPDDELPSLCARISAKAKHIIIGEMTGREWRRLGLPPVFNRSIADYKKALPGWELQSIAHPVYEHYNHPFTIMRFE